MLRVSDHSFCRSIEEVQFSEEKFLKVELSCLPDEIDVHAEAVEAVDIRKTSEHYVLDISDSLHPHEPSDDQDHRHIQANYAKINNVKASLLKFHSIKYNFHVF